MIISVVWGPSTQGCFVMIITFFMLYIYAIPQYISGDKRTIMGVSFLLSPCVPRIELKAPSLVASTLTH